MHMMETELLGHNLRAGPIDEEKRKRISWSAWHASNNARRFSLSPVKIDGISISLTLITMGDLTRLRAPKVKNSQISAAIFEEPR